LFEGYEKEYEEKRDGDGLLELNIPELPQHEELDKEEE
jgi:hypothetical protein